MDFNIASVLRIALAPYQVCKSLPFLTEGPVCYLCAHEIIAMVFFHSCWGGSTYLGAVMDGLLPRSVMDAIRRTAKSLKGYARRVFQAVVTVEYAEAKPRKAETLFGWNRDAVKRGLCERLG